VAAPGNKERARHEWETVLRLTKRTGYALHALSFMARTCEPGQRVSVREMAGALGIPEQILAKVMQTLKRGGILDGSPGSGGGYKLTGSLADVSFLSLLEIFGEGVTLTDCCLPHTDCPRRPSCPVHDRICALNQTVRRQLDAVTLRDLAGAPSPPQTQPTDDP